jgi:hypothetical protein
MRSWLTANELDSLDPAARGFRERLHPLIGRDVAVTLTWTAPGVAVAAFELAVARYLKPYEVRVRHRMLSLCYDSHVAPLESGSVCPMDSVE